MAVSSEKVLTMAQQFETQIQHLAQAGIATHLITNAADVDAVLTVARAQDMPGVRFAAAFEDGALVVGCPDGLPDILEELAVPIVVQPTATMPPDTPPANNVNDKIILLAQRIAEKMPPPVAGQDTLDQLAGLHEAIVALADNRPDAVVEETHARGDAISSQSMAPTNSGNTASDDTHQLDRVLTQLEDMSEAPSAMGGQDILATQLSEIGLQVANLARDPVTSQVFEDAFAQFQDRLFDEFSARQAAPDPLPELAQIVESQAALQAQFADISSKLAAPTSPPVDLSHQRQSFAQFATALNMSLQRFEAVAADIATPELPDPRSDFDFQAAFDALRENLASDHRAITANLMEQIETGAAQTEPALDPATQTQSFAVFTTALATIVARLESIADAMNTAIPTSPDGSLDDLKSDLARLSDELQAGVAVIRGDIDAMSGSPTVDLVTQEQNFADYGAALSMTLAHFQQVAEQIEGLIYENPDDMPTDAPDIEVESTVSDNDEDPLSQLNSSPDTQSHLAELRMDFAEKIAAQIRDKSEMAETESHEQDSKTA